ncbi:MAG: pentapeptide repeat-containing protein [Candidatus Aenigmarchaeota archaeon]|nr:pentapeptide repeat-containing protein [Candidatus Aenigmarchaeota archaeon]
MTTANDIVSSYESGRRDFSGSAARGENLSSMRLRGIIMRRCDLSFCNFSNSDLTDADFSHADLAGATLTGAILRNAKFEKADMSRANIRAAVIDNTNFRGANFMWAHLCGNDMLKADLKDAVLDWSCLIDTKLSAEQLNAVPKGAILSLSQETHEYRLKAGTGYTKPVSGYTPVISTYKKVGGEVPEYKQSPEQREIGPFTPKKKLPEHH